ncbi:hypothetical protein H6S82_22035 [Planktothrix sp. FACHB-1355]|uniref:Uncharacterized protein n=1 Tax=Aerosakkonema funiforme FACHB-1375 TaxID=2949571 RepID=A0A926ZH22_9CYAN|nr:MULTISPECIES: hypothetical protein [Oscillatoriales]MBD2182570.1 hypothetical protein [Aerosakkonema funiforme FACHB-1375]MBD3561500.1 hypothetical protein [Planktothrix sp. FACHB-1355]
MQPVSLLIGMENLVSLIASKKPYSDVQEPSFKTLPLPWTIAQLLDEEESHIFS